MDVERRIVTVLFADLVGFTALSERLDPEDVATIQDAYFGNVRDTIGRYGGQLEKFIGDAVMAVFGVPRGRDDDAERAVRAGFALLAAVDQLGARLNLDGSHLQLRVGVNSGEVLVTIGGPDAGRVTGDVVNTAARLQAAAPPGGMLVGEQTALAVADAIELGEAVGLELKGKAEPVRARQPLRIRPVRSRDDAMGSLRAPTVGRGAELARLLARLDAIEAKPRSERWLIVAPPGVGKTRLADELGASIAGRTPAAVTVRVRLRPEAGGGFDPLAALAAAALHDAGIDAADRDRAATQIQARLVATGQPPARAAVVGAELLDLVGSGSKPAATGRRSLERPARFAAWLDGLDALAGRHSQVWLVEDVHWAGPDLVAFFDAAVDRAAPAGRLLVLTARPSFLDANPDWAARDPDAGRNLLELATLSPTSAADLVHELVGDAIPDPLLERIVERSDGNCLFIEELLRTWVGTSALVVLDGQAPAADGHERARWRLTIPAAEVVLPSTVQAIYAAQLDDLPDGARQGARRAAVAGRRFPADALTALGVETPDEAVHELHRRALLAGPAPDPALGPMFAFRHALLRDAGYASLGRAERAELHVRLARWLETVASHEPDRVAAAIGDHLARALASAPVLAPEVAAGLGRDACGDEAAGWLERAAGRAAGDGASATAADALRRAVALTRRELPGAMSRRLIRLARVLAPTGGVIEAQAALAAAIDAARAARSAGDSAWRTLFARASAARASLLYEQLRFVDAWHQSEADLLELGDADDLDTALVRLARSRARSGETNEAGPWVADAERALAAARLAGDGEAEWDVIRDLARARNEAGTSTLADWLELGAEARARGDAGLEVAARTMETAWLMATAPAAVPAVLRPARELAVAHGLVERLAWIEHAESEAALAAGDWTRSIEAGLRAVDLGEKHGYDRVAVRSWAALLPAASLRGETVVLERAGAWFDARADGLPDSPYGRVLLAGSRLWLSSAGVGQASVPPVELIRPAFPQWLETGSYEWLAAAEAILDTWLSAGRADWAGEALDAALGSMPHDPFRPALIAFKLDAARLALRDAARSGGPPSAESVRSDVAELGRIGLPYWCARGIRILEELGAATPAEVDERIARERALGAVRPSVAAAPQGHAGQS